MKFANRSIVLSIALVILVTSLVHLGGNQYPHSVDGLHGDPPTRNGNLTLSGFVFDSSGVPIEGPFMGPPTQIKVVELNTSSVPMAGGAYSIGSISSGVYTVRAYFGSIDHSVIYRNMRIEDNTTLNWTHGKTWVTGKVMNSLFEPITPPFMGPPTTVKVVETQESVQPNSYGEYTVSDLSVGGHYTIRAYFGTIDHSTNYINIVPVGGTPNDIDFVNGRNGLYGYVFGDDGTTSLPGEKVELISNGMETFTDDDGFYTFQNITTGANDTLKITFVSKDNYTMEEEVGMTSGDLGPFNITYMYIPEYTGLRLNGYVLDGSGSPISGPFMGPPTTIKIVELNQSVMPMGGGYYEFVNLSSGTYTIRAYFGSIDHSVVYRELHFNDNMTLNWTHGKTWITGHILDSAMEPVTGPFMAPPTTVKNVNTGESVYPDMEGCFEISNVTVGDYILFRAYYGSINHFASYVMIKAVGATSNVHEFINGKNSVYGYIFDVDGTTPLEGEMVEAQPADVSTTTNEDGFYVMKDLPSGENQTVTVTFTSKNSEIAVDEIEITTGDLGPLNFTFGLVLPDTPVFITRSSVVDSGDYTIEWEEAENAQEYFLLEDGVVVYHGTELTSSISGKKAGSYEYAVIAWNENGNSSSSAPIIITVKGGSSSDDLWVPGMEWEFLVESESAGMVEIDNITLTVLEKETLKDLNDADVEAFKVKRKWEKEPDTISYMWYDAVNLDKVKGSTDYGQQYSSEMSYGWTYGSAPKPYTIGTEIDLEYDAQIKVSVPGHPLITRNTENTFVVQGVEDVTVPFGTFECYNITITDKDDDIVSWNYYYSDEIKHWVKMVDRLSDGMSDVVTYTLKDASIPSIPVITSESGEVLDKDVTMKWSEYPNAMEYLLYEDGILVYNGTDLNITLVNRPNGEYRFTLKVLLSTGLSEVSEEVMITVNWSIPAPAFSTEDATIDSSSFNISWDPIEGAERYVLYENDVEIYNGTLLAWELTGKTNGLYRYRIIALNTSYGSSQPSTSLLITVDIQDVVGPDDDDDDQDKESDSDMDPVVFIIIAVIVLILIIILFVIFRGRGKDEESAYDEEGAPYIDEVASYEGEEEEKVYTEEE